jgi:hypothetical protein
MARQQDMLARLPTDIRFSDRDSSYIARLWSKSSNVSPKGATRRVALLPEEAADG